MRSGLAVKSPTIASAIFAGEKSLFANLADSNLTKCPDQELTDYYLILFDLDDFAEAVRLQAAVVAPVLAALSTEWERL